MKSTRVPALSDAERAALMVEVRRSGEVAACHRLGLSRTVVQRALARLPLRDGSVLLVRHGLASVKTASAASSPPGAA